MNNLSRPTGLYVPLCTPMYHGEFDTESHSKFIQSIDPYVDGYVPCLSSGEGDKMDIGLWKQVLSTTLISTSKPIYVGIKSDEIAQILEMTTLAQTLGATGITIPVSCKENPNIAKHISTVAKHTTLPLIIYNTEDSHVSDLDTLQQILESNPNIVAIKDSSMNQGFFQEMIQAKKSGKLDISILQGMEHQIKDSLQADGALVSIANIEPELCKRILSTQDQGLLDELDELFWKYNLGGDRYISLKAILMSKGIFKSAEQIDTAIQP